MEQLVSHGGTIDAVTTKEMQTMVNGIKTGLPVSNQPSKITRIRATSSIILDENGDGVLDIYQVPLGYEFELRRVNFDGNGTPSNTQGGDGSHYITYLRSGRLIAYANPNSYLNNNSDTSTTLVPGNESWSSEQGPILKNGEVLSVGLNMLTNFTTIDVEIQGLLKEIDTPKVK